MDTRDMMGRVAVVTGAASGIGRATALALASRHARLSLCDVDDKGLGETVDRIVGEGGHAIGRRVDTSNREQMRVFADETWEEYGRTDLVVNNAGIGVGGLFVDVPLEEWDRIVGVNLMGVVHGCAFFTPRMIESGRGGHIVNIASMAGYCAAPGMTAYDATKFAVVGLSESLRMELAEHGIGVTVICPGVINTPIVRNSPMYGASATPESRERGIRVFERRNYGPERVAEGILEAVAKNRGVAPVSPEARVGYWIKRFAPGVIHALGRAGMRRELARSGDA